MAVSGGIILKLGNSYTYNLDIQELHIEVDLTLTCRTITGYLPSLVPTTTNYSRIQGSDVQPMAIIRNAQKRI